MINKSLEYSVDKEMLLKKTEDENWQKLQDSFAELYKIQDENQQLYKLVAIVKQYDIPLDVFRSLFENYCKQQSEALSAKSRWKLPFLHTEHFFEALARLLDQMDLFKVLEKLSSLSIIFAVAVFFWEIPQRTEQAQYEAWKIIKENEGKPASGGRLNALKNLNKDKVSLAGLNLKGAILPRLDLSGADLFKANFENAILNDAQLPNANLKNAALSRADLSHAKLNGAKLSGADLSHAKLWGADLSNADLKRIIPDNKNEALLSGTNLQAADLRGITLSKADLRNVDLRKANLSDVDLKEANLQGALYDEETKFPTGFDPRSKEAFPILPFTDLSKKDLRLANLSEAKLNNANLSNANLSGSILKKAKLSKANLSDADLSGADLSDADLSGADLSGADLRGAKLSGADVKGANFRGVHNLVPEQVNSTKNSELVPSPDYKIAPPKLKK